MILKAELLGHSSNLISPAPSQNKPLSIYSGRKIEILVGGTVMIVAGAAAAILLWPAALAVSLASAVIFLHGHLRAPSKTIQEINISPLVPIPQREEPPLIPSIVQPLQQEPPEIQIDPPQEKSLRARTIAASGALLTFALASAAFFYKRPSPSLTTSSAPDHMQLIAAAQKMDTSTLQPTQQMSTALVSTRPLFGKPVYLKVRSLKDQFNHDDSCPQAIEKHIQPEAQNASPELTKRNLPTQDSQTLSHPTIGLKHLQVPSTKTSAAPALQAATNIKDPFPTPIEAEPQTRIQLPVELKHLEVPSPKTPVSQAATNIKDPFPTPIETEPQTRNQLPIELKHLQVTSAKTPVLQAATNIKNPFPTPIEAETQTRNRLPVNFKPILLQSTQVLGSAKKILTKVIRAAADALPRTLNATTNILTEAFPVLICEAATRSLPQALSIAQGFAAPALNQTVSHALTVATPSHQFISGMSLFTHILSGHLRKGTSLLTREKLYADQKGNPWNLISAGTVPIAIPCKAANQTFPTDLPKEQSPSMSRLVSEQAKQSVNRLTDFGKSALSSSTKIVSDLFKLTGSILFQIGDGAKDDFLFYGTKLCTQEIPDAAKAAAAWWERINTNIKSLYLKTRGSRLAAAPSVVHKNQTVRPHLYVLMPDNPVICRQSDRIHHYVRYYRWAKQKCKAANEAWERENTHMDFLDRLENTPYKCDIPSSSRLIS